VDRDSIITIIAAVVGFVTLIPAALVARRTPVRRELRAQPVLGAVAGVGLLAVLAVAWITRDTVAAALPFVAVLLVALVAFTWWRGRVTYGASRGLPPGSLGFGVSLDAIEHQAFYAQAAARHGPIFKMAQFHRPVVCIVELKTGLDVLEGQRARLHQPTLPFGRLSPGNYIEFMNDARHARYREILRTALSGRVIAAARPGIEDAMRVQLGACAREAGAAGVDPRPWLERLAFASLVRTMFGIPPTDPRIDQLRALFDQLGSTRAFVEQRPEERVPTFEQLVALVRGMGRDLLAAEGLSPATSVLSEALRADARHLDDDTLLGNLVLIVHVTRSNIRGLLSWVLKELLDHPEVIRSLRDAESTGVGPERLEAVATQVVNETLRMHQSEYLYREVADEVEVGTYRIPKGWLLRVCVRECHDNPAVFPEPQEFRIQRFAGRAYDRTEYCPFSDGTHSCFGAGLALMIARCLVTVLALESDGRIVADGPTERDGNRHWSHWRPNARLRISLAARADATSAGDRAASAARTRSGVAGISSIQAPHAS
jgi:cytochrome P450